MRTEAQLPDSGPAHGCQSSGVMRAFLDPGGNGRALLLLGFVYRKERADGGHDLTAQGELRRLFRGDGLPDQLLRRVREDAEPIARPLVASSRLEVRRSGTCSTARVSSRRRLSILGDWIRCRFSLCFGALPTCSPIRSSYFGAFRVTTCNLLEVTRTVPWAAAISAVVSEPTMKAMSLH